MNLRITLSVLLMTIFIGLYGQDFEKVSQPDQEKLTAAKKFANDYLLILKAGNYYKFQDDEATDILKNMLTEPMQKLGYSQIKAMYGDYQSLEFTEGWKQKSSGFLVYRMKGKFERSEDKLEIRVTTDSQGKIAGFFVKPWTDALQ